jgi:hypothetical protein
MSSAPLPGNFMLQTKFLYIITTELMLLCVNRQVIFPLTRAVQKVVLSYGIGHTRRTADNPYVAGTYWLLRV